MIVGVPSESRIGMWPRFEMKKPAGVWRESLGVRADAPRVLRSVVIRWAWGGGCR